MHANPNSHHTSLTKTYKINKLVKSYYNLLRISLDRKNLLNLFFLNTTLIQNDLIILIIYIRHPINININ